jgi:hypothetical protein
VNTLNIDYLIDVLQRCKAEGCREILFVTEQEVGEPVQETVLTIIQDDGAVIFSTKKMRI